MRGMRLRRWIRSGFRSGIWGAVMLLWIAAALFAPWWVEAPDGVVLERILVSPAQAVGGGLSGSLGYDDLGRPVLERLLVGARTSLLVAFGVVALSALVGTAAGAAAGYLGGLWDLLLVRLMDLVLAFPGILLAIALAGLLGPGIDNVVVALAAVGWVGYARLARAQVLSLRERDHVRAAVALGLSPALVVTRHILPLAAAPLIVEATFGIAGAVVAEAGLAFLGLGVQPPAASWGAMVRDGARYMLVAPHLVLAPGLALMLVVLAVNRLGDRLRDRWDVRVTE